jgi:polyisoprenoid-binding protein YceI
MHPSDQNQLTAQRNVGNWTLDSEQTTIAITHKTLWGMVTVKGQFTEVTGEGDVLDGGALRGELTITASSLDTQHAKRDKHLRSADFFDADHFPAITVRVLSGTVREKQPTELTAELSVRDVREPLTLIANISQTTPDTVTVDTETTIDRERFGLSWNRMGMMTGLAGVTVHAVFTKQS